MEATRGWRGVRAGFGGMHVVASALRGRVERCTHTSCRPKQRRPKAAGDDVT
jgi:hypothetical protein